MKYTIIALALAGLGALGATQEEKPSQVSFSWKKQQPQNDAVVIGLLSKFRARLIDPDSAEFRNVTLLGDTLIGEVNAKNRLGAWAGWKTFAVREADL